MSVKRKAFDVFNADTVGVNSENIAFENGKMIAGAGLENTGRGVDFGALSLGVTYGEEGDSTSALWLCLDEDGCVNYESEDTGMFIGVSVVGEGEFAYVSSERTGVLGVFCGSAGVAIISRDGSVRKACEESVLPWAAEFHERLFFAKAPRTICYTAVSEPSRFAESADDSGTVELNMQGGAIVGLCVLDERVYVIREYGVTKLDARGAGRDFVFVDLPYGGGRIYENSARACGEYLFFLASDGLYRFSTSGCKRVCDVPTDMKASAGVRAACAEGYYYLSYLSTGGRRRTLAVDESGENRYTLIGVDALSGANGECFGVWNGQIYRLKRGAKLPNGESRFAFIKGENFGNVKEKTVRKVSVCGVGKVSVSVCGGRHERSVTLELTDGKAEGKLTVKGLVFDIGFLLEEDTRVDSFVVEYEEVKV